MTLTVRLRVRARNAAGESGPSPVVEVKVLVAALSLGCRGATN